MQRVFETAQKATRVNSIGAGQAVQAKPAAGLGIFVAAANGATITVLDGTTTIVGATSVNAGQWIPVPYEFADSIVITTAGTSIDCTFYWSPRQ